MKIVNSYKCKITNGNDVFKPTITIYRDAVTYLINVIYDNYIYKRTFKIKEKYNYIEKLIHKTKENPAPSYDFDYKFYKFPSYLRRCAVADALGIVSSYQSNLENYRNKRYEYISNGKKFKEEEPKLSLKHFNFPSLYKNNMFNKLNPNEVEIKIFHKNDWVWFKCNLRQQDVKYILNNTQNSKELSPYLVKSGTKYYLSFPYEKNVKLNDTPLNEQLIVGVDLGINNSAVCSLIKYDGTVTNRLFINQKVEKDRLYRLTNRLCKIQKLSGTKTKLPNLWRKINNLNLEITNKTVNKIVNFAIENNATTIVFEYLGSMPKPKSRKAKRIRIKLQQWAKRTIQTKVEHKAHSYGIRIARVCAKNTSSLAYDGSGKVLRDKNNFSLCSFSNGKKYNTDLSASYNIGARYFVKHTLKSCDENRRLLLQAKVPEIENRTKCTLSTLISITKIA